MNLTVGALRERLLRLRDLLEQGILGLLLGRRLVVGRVGLLDLLHGGHQYAQLAPLGHAGHDEVVGTMGEAPQSIRRPCSRTVRKSPGRRRCCSGRKRMDGIRRKD